MPCCLLSAEEARRLEVAESIRGDLARFWTSWPACQEIAEAEWLNETIDLRPQVESDGRCESFRDQGRVSQVAATEDARASRKRRIKELGSTVFGERMLFSVTNPMYSPNSDKPLSECANSHPLPSCEPLQTVASYRRRECTGGRKERGGKRSLRKTLYTPTQIG